MSHIRTYRTIGLCVAASLLMAVGCTIESSSSDDEGGEGGTSTLGGNSAKTGGTSSKSGTAAGGASTSTGGTKSSGLGGAATNGGATSAAAGSNALSNAGSTHREALAGSAGTSAASVGGSAGSSGTENGAAGAPSCINAEAQQQAPTPCAGIPEKCTDGTTASPAFALCFDAWSRYKAPVALAIQECLAAFPPSFDPCDTGSQVALDVCQSAMLANTCPSASASLSCATWAVTCAGLDITACQTRLSAALDATDAITCIATSSVADCNQQILGCI